MKGNSQSCLCQTRQNREHPVKRFDNKEYCVGERYFKLSYRCMHIYIHSFTLYDNTTLYNDTQTGVLEIKTLLPESFTVLLLGMSIYER